MIAHAIRLLPEQDLRVEIEKFSLNAGIHAGCVLTCVGSLKKATLRMADENLTKTYVGNFEIVGLAGTFEKGNSHLHICISDAKGKMYGGHLKNGSIIRTTAEIIIFEMSDVEFIRKFDPSTGYKELLVKKKL